LALFFQYFSSRCKTAKYLCPPPFSFISTIFFATEFELGYNCLRYAHPDNRSLDFL